MIPENIRSIIEKLSEKTLSKSVEWNKSTGVDGFKLMLKIGIVSIDKFYSSNENYWLMEFMILNDRGETIERLLRSDAEEKEDYIYLNDFYNLVRRKYLKADETLIDLLDELKENPEQQK